MTMPSSGIVGLATTDVRSYAPPVDFALDQAVRSAAVAHVDATVLDIQRADVAAFDRVQATSR